jgi:virginiamycin B lyase
MAQAPQVTFTRYDLPSAGFGIPTGPDGALWFTEARAYQIGRITTAGLIAESGTTSGSPGGIADGPDGTPWFTEYNPNLISRITTSGLVAE